MSKKTQSSEVKSTYKALDSLARRDESLQHAVVALLKQIIKTEPEKSIKEKLGDDALGILALLTPDRQKEVTGFQKEIIDAQAGENHAD